jgi:hypothetical protein
MKAQLHCLAVALLAATTTPTLAQFVNGNEAVKVMSDGSRKVETPPLPAATLAKPCPANQNGCAGGGWKMLETGSGLSECTEVFARDSTCRASTYGAEKRSRVWIVKSRGQWLQCALPSISDRCVGLKSLPVSAVQ